ncbi:MAG: alpha/beta hydrolase [Pararhodobacter sp.]
MISADIAPQGPINPAADAYAVTCVARSARIPRIPDIAFGPRPAQRLDVYLPQPGDSPPGGAPVFLFWHGGGYTHGHKEWCGFMAPPLQAAGAVFISANYRLFDEASNAQIHDDARAALGWALANIRDFGGDPARVVIGGHSAGANIAARVALDAPARRAAGIADDAIRAVLAMSGSYLQRRGDTHPDPALRPVPDEPDAVSDFAGPCTASFTTAFTLAWGTQERDPFPQAGAGFARILRERGYSATEMPFEGDDHFSVHLATGQADNAFVRAAMRELGLAEPPAIV